MAAVCHLEFLKVGNFNFRSGSVRQSCQISRRSVERTRSGDMADFRLFKLAAVRHLGFVFVVFVTVQNLVVIGAIISIVGLRKF